MTAGCVRTVFQTDQERKRIQRFSILSVHLNSVFFFFRILFTSSVLNLAELAALRPDLSALKKILYFHENQLIYPVRKSQDRDFQYGYNQILSW